MLIIFAILHSLVREVWDPCSFPARRSLLALPSTGHLSKSNDSLSNRSDANRIRFHCGISPLRRRSPLRPSALALSPMWTSSSWPLLLIRLSKKSKWRSLTSQKVFLNALSSRLGISDANWEDWYKVPNKRVIELGGRSYSLFYLIPQPRIEILICLQIHILYFVVEFFKSTKGRSFRCCQRFIPIDLGTREGLGASLAITGPPFPTRGGNSPYSLPNNLNRLHIWFFSLDDSYLDSLATKLGFDKGNHDAWYKVTNKMLIENEGHTSFLSLPLFR